MNPYKVYLSGPIASISPSEANSWRVYAEEKLKGLSGGKVIGINPVRHSSYVKQKQHTHMNETTPVPSRDNDILQNKHACLVRDRWDVQNCDLVLINCMGAPERISMGTCIELGMASMVMKPVIVAVDKDDKYDTDLLFSACCDMKYYDLDIALQRCCDFLLP